MTALMQAARYKHTDLCELLLSECGRQDNCGFTALLFATMSGCIDFVKKLWDKRINYRRTGDSAHDSS